MIIIRENGITLNFPDESQAVKYDDTPFYRNCIMKLPKTKAVDVIFQKDNHSVIFLELKDFRGYRIENKNRLKNGELANEFVQKIRDSVAGVWGARRSGKEIGMGFAKILTESETPVAGILLLEEDQSRPEDLRRVRRIRMELKTKIEQYAQFLNIKINVLTLAEFEKRYC